MSIGAWSCCCAHVAGGAEGAVVVGRAGRGAVAYPERPVRFFFSVVGGGGAPELGPSGPGAATKVGRSLEMRRQARMASSARFEGRPAMTLPVSV